MTTYEISSQNNNEDVTELVKHVAEKVEGVSVTFKEGGHIKMRGNARIEMSGGSIQIS